MFRALLLLVALLLFAGCNAAPDSSVPAAPSAAAPAPVGIPAAAAPADLPATLPPYQAGQSVHLRAMVELGGTGEVYLVTQWESRSRRSYEVLSANRTGLAKVAGQVVVADGVLERVQAFSGTIRVTAWQPSPAE